MRLALIALPALLLTTTPSAAATCETLRSEIEAKIARAGVAEFAVIAMDAGASAPGQAVGTCDQGNRKIMYQRHVPAAGAVAPASAPDDRRPVAARGARGVITECKDGTVIRDGDCKK